MHIYGLTGGVGSGKSEAGRRFAERGIPVIDADRIGHALLAPGGRAEQAVVEVFGEKILDSGIINREKLAALVFTDAAARVQLNAIMHPLIAREIAVRCGELDAEGHEDVIIEAALLAENGEREAWMNGLVLVLCPEAERIDRLVTFRGISRDEASRRMAAQRPPEQKREAADWVIDNSGPLEALYRQVDQVVEAIDERK